MDLNLIGRHALVCGGSDGIGRATAHELALLGANVTVLARRPDVLQAVADALPRTDGQQHGWIQADLAQTDALRAQIEGLVAGRPVHILVNNTSGPAGGPALTADISAYLDTFQRHLIANQTLVQAVVPGMQGANWGRIVNVISTSVREPIPGLGVSNTIRGAVAGWSKTLSRELAAYGITVNNVLPGYTETGRITDIVADRRAAPASRKQRSWTACGRTSPLAASPSRQKSAASLRSCARRRRAMSTACPWPSTVAGCSRSEPRAVP